MNDEDKTYSRRFGEEEDQKSEQKSREHLDTERDAPLSAIVVTVAGIATECGPGSYESTNSQHKLLQGSDTTTNARVGKFGLV